MMSKTHIAVGSAAALALAPAGSVAACAAAVIGGSLGGIIADCDIAPSKAHKDALYGRLIVVGIAAASLAADCWAGAGVCDYLVDHLGWRLIAGVALFVVLTFAGNHTAHRSFTHSLAAGVGFALAMYLACPLLLPYFAVGLASHLVLDVLNRQPVRLFWPARSGVALRLCSAKGAVNTVLMVAGTVVALALLALKLGLLAV